MANNNSLNNTSYGFTLPSLNLNFTSTAQRITGDMSNATHANRLSLQTNVIDGATSPFIIPNGTSVTSSIVCANASNPAASAFGQLQVDNASVKLVSSVLGAGVQLPIEIRIGATAAINIDNNLAVSILNTVAGNVALTVNATATGGVEVQQNTAANAGMRIYTSLNNINGPRFEMLKSRSGGNVVANDNIGQFVAYGYQTGYQYAAQIVFKAESVAASRVSGAISFWTNSTASANAVRLNISADGAVSIPATVVGNVPLTITGTNAGGLVVNQANSGIASIYCVQSSADVQPVYINNYKNRAGGNINAGDVLGQSGFYGFATTNQNAAQSRCYAESIGATRVSGAFDWFTTSTAGVSGQRLYLGSDGNVVINTPVAALTALTVNGFATAGTYAQQTLATTAGGLFNANRCLNLSGTAGSGCQIQIGVTGQVAATGGDPTLAFTNTVGATVQVGIDTSLNQYSMSTGTLGDANTFFSYDIATTQINKPRQCAFLAYLGSDDLNVTGNGAIYTLGTVTLLTEVYDQSNNFNTNGTFTAPKSGRYHFNAAIRVFGTGGLATSYQIRFNTTGGLIIGGQGVPTLGGGFFTATCSAYVNMTTGDTCTLQIQLSGMVGDTADINGASSVTYFGGTLVC